MKVINDDTELHNPKCAAAHITDWLACVGWMNETLAAIRRGLYPVSKAEGDTGTRPLYMIDGNGIAIIGINGPMMKIDSKYGGTNTVRTRRAIRHAAENNDVIAIMLTIESPGGTSAGTKELADDVKKASKVKPVHAYIEDFGASAAYWVASQATKIYANSPALVGSIGTMIVLEDISKMADAAGVKVHVVSTGDYKGTGVPGTEVTDEQLAYLQERVDDLNKLFLSAVQKGRRMTAASVKAAADGRVFIAEKAKALGLIDEIQDFDKAIESLISEGRRFKRDQTRIAKTRNAAFRHSS